MAIDIWLFSGSISPRLSAIMLLSFFKPVDLDFQLADLVVKRGYQFFSILLLFTSRF